MRMNKMEELMNAVKLNELLHKKEKEDEKDNKVLCGLAIVGAVVAVAAIAYGIYKLLTPKYEDDFEDDFDDDFFEDEDIPEGSAKEDDFEESDMK